jgi:hypothetical protein
MMKSNRRQIDVASGMLFAFAICGMAHAADKTTIPTAGDDIKLGDRVGFKADAAIFKALNGSPGQLFCAPHYTIFVVDKIDEPKANVQVTANQDGADISVAKDPKTGDTTTKVTGGTASVSQVTSDSILHVHIKSVGAKLSDAPSDSTGQKISDFFSELGVGIGWTKDAIPKSQGMCDNFFVADDTAASDSTTVKLVKDHNEYTTTVSQLSNYGVYRNGFTWGALAIPYKYEFSDHSFQAKPSAAAYVGYESWLGGVSVAAVLAVGAGGSSQSDQSTTTTNADGSKTTTTGGGGTQALYTAGAGVLITLGGSFKGGILVGKDWAGSGANYKYEGHPWLAVTLGAGF